MSYYGAIVAQLNSILNRLADEGEDWNPSEIALEVCEDHRDGLSDSTAESAFWSHCGYTEVRRMATRIINKRASDEPTPDGSNEQLVLPGYTYLQTHYVVERGPENDREPVGVAIHNMTEGELLAKELLYSKYASANKGHAEELRRYRMSRVNAIA